MKDIADLRLKMSTNRFYENCESYDESTGLIFGPDGKTHPTRKNAAFVQNVFAFKSESHYAIARNILYKLCMLQDRNPESPTYGLWPTSFEENLADISFPDFNFADFISSSLIGILEKYREYLDEELIKETEKSLELAAYCSIKRHVGLDYTNVICMSCFTIIKAGEILNNQEIFNSGKAELKRFLEYTRVCGAFSEYNSPNYIVVAAGAIENMIKYFEDEECRDMALELNDYLWEMGAKHYSSTFDEYTPPYIRNYSDLDNGRDALFIWCVTDGEYGKLPAKLSGGGLDTIRCPKKFFHLFDKDFWEEITYYRKNNIRKSDEDLTIVRNLDSPDLVLYSYKTKEYLFGAFQKTDLWGQRRNLMLIWNPLCKKFLKLCALKDGVDFSSAMAYTVQNKGESLTLLGFATDNGDKHYIVDPLTDGKFKAKKLSFMIKTGGEKKLLFEKHGSEFILRDGKFFVSIRIDDWCFDGKKGEIRLTDDGIELICFESDTPREVNLYELGMSYGVISLCVNDQAKATEIKTDGERIMVKNETGSIEGYNTPQKYNDCIINTSVNKPKEKQEEG
ncbi:MAG: hypothetical protein IKA17_02625 [Clostridia bacterium]|nr:hypothetical protein [Clostridia bacterium]